MNQARKKKPKKIARPTIQSLRVKNYRALKEIEISDLGRLTVLLGANGSGKSTLFDVFSFLAESFQFGLRFAWDKRGRAKELKTRGQEGPIEIEFQYREQPDEPLITYHLEIDEGKDGHAPLVEKEWLQWRRVGEPHGRPFRFLDYKRGKGKVITGEMPDALDERLSIPLRSAELLAVSTLGQIAEHPRIAALREFIIDWYISSLSLEQTRQQPEVGPQERLSKTGDNLANVIQYLKERHPDTLQEIFRVLQQRVPRLEQVFAEMTPDGRLLLQIKDAPFERPILSKFVSDGTLKMLAYLILLHDRALPPILGIEEPENFLYPHLLPEIAEECRHASAVSQIFVTTHSPFFLHHIQPKEVCVLYRNKEGFTQILRPLELPGIQNFVQVGATMGDLWSEKRFQDFRRD